jgi:hypothetical protein
MMKKINPILAVSILLLSASAQANMPVGGYNSEPNTESGASVAWFGIKKGDSPGGDALHAGKTAIHNTDDAWFYSTHRETKGHYTMRENRRKAGVAAKEQYNIELRQRAEAEYAHRHSPSKWH